MRAEGYTQDQATALAGKYAYEECDRLQGVCNARLTNERDVAVKERSSARDQVYDANDQIDKLWAALESLNEALDRYWEAPSTEQMARVCKLQLICKKALAK